MPFDQTELRISLRKLLMGLILTIVPLSLFGLYITTQSDKLLEQSIGTQFKALAEAASTSTSRFITDRVIDCNVIAAEPAVVNAIVASNSSYERASEATINEKLDRMQKTWNTAEAETVAKTVMSSPTAHLLRRHREIDPRFLLIIVADEKGALVAASDKPAVYLQAQGSYWEAVYAKGKGAVTVRDVLYDDATKSTYIGIAVPVVEQASARFIGAVYALVDVSSVLVEFQRGQSGLNVKTILVKDEGTVITAPNVTLAMKLKSEEYAAVRDTMGTLRGRQTGYIVADLRGGTRSVVGFADIGLREGYFNLAWVVMVSQDLREATAPLRGVGQFALLMVVLGLLMLTLMAVYFYLHRKEEFEDIEVLHDSLPPN